MTDAVVSVTAEGDVEPVNLGGGSWTRILISQETASDPAMSMGRSLFKAGALTDLMCHEADEAAVVLEGAGFLLVDGERIELATGQACHIPAGVWHAVGTDESDMQMIFGFSSPAYPPTEFRPIP